CDLGPLADEAAGGAARGGGVASGRAETGWAGGAGLAEGFDATDPACSTRAGGLAMNPASATPTARAGTSANGATARNVPRPMARIFIDHDRSAASNDSQRRCRDTTRV